MITQVLTFPCLLLCCRLLVSPPMRTTFLQASRKTASIGRMVLKYWLPKLAEQGKASYSIFLDKTSPCLLEHTTLFGGTRMPRGKVICTCTATLDCQTSICVDWSVSYYHWLHSQEVGLFWLLLQFLLLHVFVLQRHGKRL
jgi:hypothetical protein